MRTRGRSTDGSGRVRARPIRRWIATAAALALAVTLTLASTGARANIRAPIVEPQPPSSAARPVAAAGNLLIVMGESLSFRCDETSCDVEARYRIRAKEAVNTELAFVLPQASPLAVHVGTQVATVDVSSAPEPAPEDEVQFESVALGKRKLATAQARFPAAFAAGENIVSVSYKQPLGRREYGHGYFSRGRFVDYFRYELWPLSEWKHAPGFRIEGEVVIQRPRPSWWRRLFSTPRSVGCRGADPLNRVALEQRGRELHLVFQIPDPIPRRLWCEIGDDDLVPAP
jgi:hypothetical protein